MASGTQMGLLAVDKDGNLYAYGIKPYNGFDKDFKELTKLKMLKMSSKYHRWEFSLEILYVNEERNCLF